MKNTILDSAGLPGVEAGAGEVEGPGAGGRVGEAAGVETRQDPRHHTQAGLHIVRGVGVLQSQGQGFHLQYAQ